MNANAAIYFVERHVREGRGKKCAFKEADGQKRCVSYEDLAKKSDTIAGALLSAGVSATQRALMLVLDTIEFPQIFWGCLKAGVVPVPLNTLLPSSIYETIFEDCRASVLFVSSELLAVVSPLLETATWIKHIVVVGPQETKNHVYFDTFLASAEPVSCADAKADDIAFWLYSSGSTGQPKGVRHRHDALFATAKSYGDQVLSVNENDVVYSVAKMFFAYGMGNAMTFPLSAGATTILFSGRPTPQSVTDILIAEKPTVFCGVPTLYAALLAHLESLDQRPDVKFRACISAGEALPEMVGKSWSKMWGVDILDGVGSTEMLHIFLSNAADDVVYGTSGTAVPGYELRLVDEQNQNVETGGIGELLVRGGSGAKDYWNQTEKTKQTFEGGWTRTGDKYELMAGGRYIYCGRTDDMFKVSGIWVSPFEVEQALVSHPTVLEAAVVAARDDEGLEKPKAFIVLKPNQKAKIVTSQEVDQLQSDLKEFVKSSIGKWKYPRWVEIVDDLPKTATGKIQRFKLR